MLGSGLEDDDDEERWVMNVWKKDMQDAGRIHKAQLSV